MVELGIERHRVHRLRRQRGIRGLGVVVDLLIARRDDEGADLQILRRLVDDLDLAVVVPRQVRKCDIGLARNDCGERLIEVAVRSAERER